MAWDYVQAEQELQAWYSRPEGSILRRSRMKRWNVTIIVSMHPSIRTNMNTGVVTLMH